jgi:hypothetical protein
MYIVSIGEGSCTFREREGDREGGMLCIVGLHVGAVRTGEIVHAACSHLSNYVVPPCPVGKVESPHTEHNT